MTLAKTIPGVTLLAGLAMALAASPRAWAQDGAPPPLRLGGVVPAGIRNSVTESWGAFDFNVTNLSNADRNARVVTFYSGSPDVQVGRDVWVPAHATLSSWMLVGPAPDQQSSGSREIQMLLFDRSAGNSRLIPPRGSDRVRSSGLLYRKREPYTAIMLDEEAAERPIPGQIPQPDSKDEEAFDLARTFRSARGLSDLVTRVNPGALPSIPEAFDGMNHFILASGRIADDATGMQALRRWLERGGTVWVMLDMVEPESIAALLGNAFDFQVVDRVRLTSTTFVANSPGERLGEQQAQEHKRPVEFVRVLLPPHETALYTVNGWPAWFTRQVGRGKVIVTTLGPRGWVRPRDPTDRPSRYERFPGLPVPSRALETLAEELQPPAEEHPFRVEAFRPMLTSAIGYAVVSRGTVLLVYAPFVLIVLALVLALRRSRRSQLLAWLSPTLAIAAAAVFFILGEASRRTTPTTVAVGQVIDAQTGSEEAPVQGLMAVYRPQSGATEIGAEQGGLFELDMTALEGQTRLLVVTDLDSWHWENLSLPAGVRFAPFQFTAGTGEPVTAVAGFGPEGMEGKLTAGSFQGLGDALLISPGARKLAVQLRPDGTFRAGSEDILAADQFLAGAVLTDRQQRRQELYREFLKQPGRFKERTVLAWAEPADMHFTLGSEARLIGDALVVIPLRLRRPPTGTLVTIPGPLIPCRRVMEQGLAPPSLESFLGTAMHLRFQLPAELLPLKAERARLAVKINASTRRVTIAGLTDRGPIELHSVANPLDPIRLDITQEQLLRLDGEGGLQVNVSVSDSMKGAEEGQGGVRKEEKWTIEYLELEVVGRIEKDEG